MHAVLHLNSIAIIILYLLPAYQPDELLVLNDDKFVFLRHAECVHKVSIRLEDFVRIDGQYYFEQKIVQSLASKMNQSNNVRFNFTVYFLSYENN